MVFIVSAKIVDLTRVSQISARAACYWAISVCLQTAAAANKSGPIYETFFCSGSLEPAAFAIYGRPLVLINPN